MTDYEVVWNGAHEGRDADLLLRSSRIPEKRQGTSRPMAGVSIGETVASCLAQHGSLTARQIAEVTGFTTGTVNDALTVLRKSGCLRSARLKDAELPATKTYWLAASDAC